MKRFLFYLLSCVIISSVYCFYTVVCCIPFFDDFSIHYSKSSQILISAICIISIAFFILCLYIAFMKNKKCAIALIIYAFIGIPSGIIIAYFVPRCPQETPLKILGQCYSCNTQEAIEFDDRFLPYYQNSICPNRELIKDGCVFYSVVKGYKISPRNKTAWDIQLDGPGFRFYETASISRKSIFLFTILSFFMIFMTLLFLALHKTISYKFLLLSPFFPLLLPLLFSILSVLGIEYL